MEITFETEYTQAAVTAMVKCLRKTLRRKKSLASHILGWLLVALGIALTLPLDGGPFTLTGRTVLNLTIALLMALMLLFEDNINAFVARRRMLAQGRRSVTTFCNSSYTSVTDLGKTDFYYGNIRALAETDAYLVLVYDANHGQVYDKAHISGGTLEEFRGFLTGKTNKEIVRVK